MMNKISTGTILFLFCFLVNCANNMSVIDYNTQKKWEIVLEHLKRDSAFLEYANSHGLNSNEIYFNVSSRNIYPTLFCFEGLASYKKKIDKTFNEDIFFSILDDFKVKHIELNENEAKEEGPFKIYFTQIQNDIFCQIYFENGHNLWEREKYIEYLGTSLGYYLIFNKYGKVKKSFVCESDHG